VHLVGFVIRMKLTITLSGLSAEVLNVGPGGVSTYHCQVNCYVRSISEIFNFIKTAHTRKQIDT